MTHDNNYSHDSIHRKSYKVVDDSCCSISYYNSEDYIENRHNPFYTLFLIPFLFYEVIVYFRGYLLLGYNKQDTF